MNNHKPKKIYRNLDTKQFKKEPYDICNNLRNSCCNNEETKTSSKYIKILPNDWIVKNNDSFQFSNLDQNNNTIIGSKYILNNASLDFINNNSIKHNINSTLIKRIPNIFLQEDCSNNNDVYWEYIYDISNIIYDINTSNKENIVNIIEQLIEIINTSDYIKHNIKPESNIDNINRDSIKLYKSAKLYKNNDEISKNISNESDLYRIIFTYKICNDEYPIEIVVSETNYTQQVLTILYIGFPVSLEEFSIFSSIILDSNQYSINISNQNSLNCFGITLSNTKNILNNNIYVFPTLYAIINIPQDHKIKKIKINSNQQNSNININIWEAFLNCKTPIHLHETGYFNQWIYIKNTDFIGEEPGYSSCNTTKGNYLLIEIPYIDNNVIIYGGEILLSKNKIFKKDNILQVEIPNIDIEQHKNNSHIQHVTECNIDNID